MTKITTHVLDIALGKPAANIPITLHSLSEPATIIAEGLTNSDGRVSPCLYEGALARGLYSITFALANYFANAHQGSLYPFVTVHFVIDDIHQHFHLPLLVSPGGYSTYRGS